MSSGNILDKLFLTNTPSLSSANGEGSFDGVHAISYQKSFDSIKEFINQAYCNKIQKMVEEHDADNNWLCQRGSNEY